MMLELPYQDRTADLKDQIKNEISQHRTRLKRNRNLEGKLKDKKDRYLELVEHRRARRRKKGQVKKQTS